MQMQIAHDEGLLGRPGTGRDLHVHRDLAVAHLHRRRRHRGAARRGAGRSSTVRRWRRSSATCASRTSEEAYQNVLDLLGEDYASVITPDQLNETYWINLVDQRQSDVILEAFRGTEGVEEVQDQLAVPRAALLGADRRDVHRRRHRRADADRRGAADRDDDPALGLCAKAGARHHAAGRGIQSVHPDAVHPGGRVRGAHRVDPGQRGRHRGRALRRRPVPARAGRVRDDVGRRWRMPGSSCRC